jgi:hypothetical protein
MLPLFGVKTWMLTSVPPPSGRRRTQAAAVVRHRHQNDRGNCQCWSYDAFPHAVLSWR